MNDRHLNWPNCYNARDLGGLVGENGRILPTHRFVRADILSRLDEAGHQAMYDYGIRTVIDLRFPEEVAKYDYPDLHPEMAYHNMPLETREPEVGELINQASSRGEVYCIILDHYPELVANVMRTIINADEGGIVFHCYAGKDRTGTVAGLLLKLVGVPNDLIAADYAESQGRLRPLYDEEVTRVGAENIGFWGQQTVTEEMMHLMLDHVDAKYGSVENYLRQAGLTDTELAALKKRLLD